MSDSDDTDVLLLIPPDLFLVPSSSDSDASSDCAKISYSSRKTGVISELVGHMQSLETRICAIESKDNSLDTTLLNNSLESQIQGSTITRSRQTLSKPRFYVSQTSSLQTTPVKPRQSLSVPSTPNGYSSSKPTNFHRNDMRSGHHFPVVVDTNAINANGLEQTKHDILTSYSDSSMVIPASHSKGLSHAAAASSKRELYSSRSIDYCRNAKNPCDKSCDQLQSTSFTSTLPSALGQQCPKSKTVQEMELAEVNERLQEIEATELELSKRINNATMYQYLKEHANAMPSTQANDIFKHEEEDILRKHFINRKLDFPSTSRQRTMHDAFPDLSLPYESFLADDTDKVISEFKTWEHGIKQPVPKTGQHKVDEANVGNNVDSLSDRITLKPGDTNIEESVPKPSNLNLDYASTASTISMHNLQPHPPHKNIDALAHKDLSKYNVADAPKYMEPNPQHLADNYKNSQQSLNPQQNRQDIPLARCTVHASTNTDFLPRKSQRFLLLSDFWEDNTNKTQEEKLSIKLEEEKFRREHCEHLIQELQKRLLEQQEKVAVALRVDNEKNDLIAQFHAAWSKLKQRVHALESEHGILQTNLQTVTEKHQMEILEFQSQIKRCEGELSKALDLAAGYKEKSDGMIKEKVDLLKAHADELENYKSLVQEAENRYEQMKREHNKLLEKNQQTEEALRSLQQELSKERLRGGEVRNEMNVIHKALDTCETELTILRQEKENLQLKLKEEINRNAILEQKNFSLLSSVDDAKKAERLAKEEMKSLAEQKEQIRAELQEVYQKQVDEVVKTKLQEFQTQLDAAESEFLEELKTRQQVIAECAARKIKDIMDKHRLEINLLEEKHREEKRLCELQLAQVAQKSSILETQLSSQRAAKSQLAEQLHSVMQKQWQQALKIISGSGGENLTPLQRIHAEKLFESKGPRKSESMPNCYAKISQEPMKLATESSETTNFHVRRDDQNESLSTMTPINDTPVTSRKEPKDDLRKYIRMIAEMQQPREEFHKVRDNVPSPPLVCREVPRKHYMKKELSIMSEDSVTWQPVSETSTHNNSEYLSVPQKLGIKADQQKVKPPWK